MTKDGSTAIREHTVVSREQWLSARKTLLEKEKEFTRLRDELSRQRRQLPWVKVDKPYVFVGPNGKETLAQLFGTKSQLIVYHFMFDPSRTRAARTARSGPTTTTVPGSTCLIGTCRWW